jgi:hypothetical protein
MMEKLEKPSGRFGMLYLLHKYESRWNRDICVNATTLKLLKVNKKISENIE